MKKVLSLILALAMLLGCFSLASAEDAAPLAGKIIILHTNDIHGRAMSTSSELGYARIATMKKNLQALGAEVILVDSGDYSQGQPIVNLSTGASAFDFMNAAGYDVAILGNHEFDWGTDNLLLNAEKANFAIICANLIRTSDNTTVFAPNYIYEGANGKIGFFGLATPETQTKAHPDKVRGVNFLSDAELFACAQAQVDELKAAGCDVIVALGHLGVSDESIGNRSIDVMNNVTGIDLFIDGHSHTEMDLTNMNYAAAFGAEFDGSKIVSTGNYSQNLGYVVISVAKTEEKTTVSISASLYTQSDLFETMLSAGMQVEKDSDVDALVSAVNDQVEAELGAAFATSEVLLNGERAPGVRTEETNLGDFAADAILWAAQQALGEDAAVAALTNGGGIRASIPAGDITMKDMKTVFPFGNQVTVLYVTGAELLEALEAATWSTPDAIGAFPQVSGIVFTIDTTVPYEKGEQYPGSTYYAPANPGSRVTIESVGGKAFDPEAIYGIATNDFTAAGGDTYYAFKYSYQTSGYKTGVALEDALVNYTHTVLGDVVGEQYAAPQGRITVK